jgi:hypothetical protein
MDETIFLCRTDWRYGSSFKTMLTSLCTTGDTTRIVGKATANAKSQAFSQIEMILLTHPTLKMLITSDMKNENTIL